MNFYAEHTDISYGKNKIVEALSMEIPEGKITALIGANGSGKSTIPKTLCRIMKLDSGQVILDGRSIHQMKEFSRRGLEQLSGGQRQRAWIAMCLAQNTEILFLDEPTTYLDISYQLDILKLLKQLNEEYKKTIVMVVHDLNHASLFADHIVAIKKARS